MARGLLVSFAGYPYTPSSLMPDNGLASLAACLQEAGHEARILDFGTVGTLARLFPPSLSRGVTSLIKGVLLEEHKPSLRDKLLLWWTDRRLRRHQRKEVERIACQVTRTARDWGADFVGFKLWTGIGFLAAVQAAELIRRELPHVSIFAGGPHVDYFGEKVFLATSAFDALVRHEGEHVIVPLAEWATDGREPETIPNLIYRDGGSIRTTDDVPLARWEALPLPAYDVATYPALDGDQKIKIGILDESRGCPHRCFFCIHPVKSGGRWKVKSPERVLREVQNLREHLGTNTFVYAGSNTPAKAATENARALFTEGMRVRYACFGHVRDMHKADFRLLKRSGCQAIFYGIESASPRILRDSLNKGSRPEMMRQVLRMTKEEGIYTIASIIYPSPWEDEESRRSTLDFLTEVRPDSVPVTIPGLIPGTTWAREPERFGFDFRDGPSLWKEAMTYEIKLLFPPAYWKPLPYRLHGKTSREFFAESAEFVRAIEDEGMLTDVPHELYLMSQVLQMEPREFRDLARAALLCGDAEAVAAMVKEINSRCRPAPEPGLAAPHSLGGR